MRYRYVNDPAGRAPASTRRTILNVDTGSVFYANSGDPEYEAMRADQEQEWVAPDDDDLDLYEEVAALRKVVEANGTAAMKSALAAERESLKEAKRRR